MAVARPPGPADRGIIGNFPLGSKDPLGLFRQWATLYGDIVHYRALHRHVYMLNHPDLVKDVLLTNARNFIKGDALRNNRRIFGNGLLTNEGEPWLQQRRLMQPAFRHDRIQAYGQGMVRHAEGMIAGWQDGQSSDIYVDMMRVTLKIVTEELFNVQIAADRDRFAAGINTLLEVSSGGRILLPPLLRMVPTPGNLRYHRAARRLDEIVYGLISRRKAEIAETNVESDDLFSVMLRATDENGVPMSDQQIRDEVLTLLLAGHETTAVALSWTWYLLAKHPQVERALWAELGRVLNGRSPGPQDLAQLPYTERVIKEAMRLYPPIWAVVRSPIEDCDIGGYRVPAGSTVLMSQWVMHRDPRFYPDPERFDPDRWVDGRGPGTPASIPKFAYFPFGAGPRTCIGASFAMMEAVLVLATAAQQFQIRLAPDCLPEPLPSITLRPRHGIRVVLARRPDQLDRGACTAVV
ncbi:MAG: cytochrome P450 [Acidobacteriaceae bacterium]